VQLKATNNGWSFTHTIKINQFYFKVNETKRHLDDERYKNITVMV